MILGYRPDEVVDRGFKHFICPDDAANTQTGLARAASAQDLTDFRASYSSACATTLMPVEQGRL
jgi:hypothetical protein